MKWTLNHRTFSGLSRLLIAAEEADDFPLIVALHGGTYTSLYFDVPGHSLLSRAAVLGVPAIAIDRPGYGSTELRSSDEASQASNAAILDAALLELWSEVGRDRIGMVLLGQSIGGAVALRIAARRPSWPLLGVAVSGVGMRIAGNAAEAAKRFPPAAPIEMPHELKRSMMFGLPASFLPSSAQASSAADALTPSQELIEISTQWPREAAGVLAAIDVPVHYRQAEQDRLWIADETEVGDFARACANSPLVDAKLVANAGHCIDFHRVGASFQLDQISFVLRCGANARIAKETSR